MINNYLQQLEQLVAKLDEHPKIKVLNFRTFPPVSNTLIETIGREIGHVLPMDYQQLFLTTNGVRLEWTFEPIGSSKKKTSVVGRIYIPALEEIFDEENLQSREMKFYLDRFALGAAVNISFATDQRFGLQLSDYLGIMPLNDYLNYLMATKGFIALRSELFGAATNSSPMPDWSLDALAVRYYFSGSHKKGANSHHLKTEQMQAKAVASPAITPEDLQAITQSHHEFLRSGGIGGKWQSYHLGGLVFGIYINPNPSKNSSKGVQALLERRNFSGTPDQPNDLNTKYLELPFANLCGCYAKAQDFEGADISHSFVTDAMLQGASFEQAQLQYCDFSRSNLRNVNFRNAQLHYCDFENCDLSNADFTGATWDNARFNGAILKDIKY